MPPKLSSIIDSRRLLQILATSFSPKMLSKNEEEKRMGEMGEFEHSNSRKRIDEK
jgi:hypothetical protein